MILYPTLPAVIAALVLSGCAWSPDTFGAVVVPGGRTVRAVASRPTEFRLVRQSTYFARFGDERRVLREDARVRDFVSRSLPQTTNVDFRAEVGPQYMAVTCGPYVVFKPIHIRDVSEVQEVFVDCNG